MQIILALRKMFRNFSELTDYSIKAGKNGLVYPAFERLLKENEVPVGNVGYERSGRIRFVYAVDEGRSWQLINGAIVEVSARPTSPFETPSPIF